jgi:hypothetical protein
MAEAELSELRSSLVTREEQLEAVKQARHLVITLVLHNLFAGRSTRIQTSQLNPNQAAAMQGVTDQRQAMQLNEAIGEAEQVAG